MSWSPQEKLIPNFHNSLDQSDLFSLKNQTIGYKIHENLEFVFRWWAAQRNRKIVSRVPCNSIPDFLGQIAAFSVILKSLIMACNDVKSPQEVVRIMTFFCHRDW